MGRCFNSQQGRLDGKNRMAPAATCLGKAESKDPPSGQKRTVEAAESESSPKEGNEGGESQEFFLGFLLPS